jgi:hypothetical protein
MLAVCFSPLLEYMSQFKKEQTMIHIKVKKYTNTQFEK